MDPPRPGWVLVDEAGSVLDSDPSGAAWLDRLVLDLPAAVGLSAGVVFAGAEEVRAIVTTGAGQRAALYGARVRWQHDPLVAIVVVPLS